MRSVARRHHFLPQGYLAGFTDTGKKDGRLHVVDLKTRRCFRTTPLNVALESDFKRVDMEGRSPDAVEVALAPIEDRAVQAVRRVAANGEFPNDADYNLILNLLSLLLAQNPKSRRSLNAMREKEVEAKLEWLISSQANWEHHISIARAGGEVLNGDVSYESARRFVDERRFRIEFENKGTLRREFQAQDELLAALAKRTWSILLAPDGGPYFICSDYPYSLVMEHGFREVPGFLTQNTELFFPLSKTVGFMGVLGTPLEPVVHITSEAVAIMNHRIFRRADRQLFLSQDSFFVYERGSIVEMQV